MIQTIRSRGPYCVNCAWEGRGMVGRATQYLQPIQLENLRHEVTVDLCTVCGELAQLDAGFRHGLAVQALKARARR